MVEKVEEFVGDYSMACSFRSLEDNLLWAFASFYGPNLDSDHCLLCEELVRIISWWNLPTCIGGDFNVIRFLSERSSSCRLGSAKLEFSKFIPEMCLTDLPLMGGAFTWSNKHT